MTDMAMARERWQIKTLRVLDMVFEERVRQVAQYGHNLDLEDGHGPDAQWLQPFTSMPAVEVQKVLRDDYENHKLIHDLPTWMHLIREEIAEAFEADDDEALVRELLQVAALCVSWVEKKVADREPAFRGES